MKTIKETAIPGLSDFQTQCIGKSFEDIAWELYCENNSGSVKSGDTWDDLIEEQKEYYLFAAEIKLTFDKVEFDKIEDNRINYSYNGGTSIIVSPIKKINNQQKGKAMRYRPGQTLRSRTRCDDLTVEGTIGRVYVLFNERHETAQVMTDEELDKKNYQ